MHNTDAKVINDLKDRGLKIVSLIVEDANARLSIMQYNSDGNAIYISPKVNTIQFNEQLEGRMVSPMGSIGQSLISNTMPCDSQEIKQKVLPERFAQRVLRRANLKLSNYLKEQDND